MKKVNRPLIKAFLKATRAQFVLFLMLLSIFSSIYLFGRLPADLLIYTLELTSFLFVLFLLSQYYSYAKRYEKLIELQKPHINLENNWPDCVDPADYFYHQKIRLLADQLHQTQQQYGEKNSEQLEYFTLWLHQIKTPIAAMSLLMQSHTDQQLAKQVNQELLRLEDYTHMALNYLKIEESGTDMDFTEVALDEVIKHTVKKYAILFIYNQITLEFEETHLTVLTDGKWLKVLLEQLLSNSLKYSIGGTVKLYLDPKQPERLIIEDTGIGIRAQDLPRIFEKGYSGLNGRLHEKSTGLGLFLSQKIVHRLGHHLSIDSVLGKGTKVTLDLTRNELQLFD